jgi:hypothetical protein
MARMLRYASFWGYENDLQIFFTSIGFTGTCDASYIAKMAFPKEKRSKLDLLYVPN